jgi:DNA-directed RNA polymerase sigma subunit (sigma70/sigma32)
MKCFEFCNKKSIECKNKNCRYWIEHTESKNCTVIAAHLGPMTLQQIGEIFGVTRMRICQIEKKILSKLSSSKDRTLHI